MPVSGAPVPASAVSGAAGSLRPVSPAAGSVSPAAGSALPAAGSPVGLPAAGSPVAGVPAAGSPLAAAGAGPASPVSPAGQARSVGRVVVPGAQPPGRSAPSAQPAAPTRQMSRYDTPTPSRPATYQAGAASVRPSTRPVEPAPRVQAPPPRPSSYESYEPYDPPSSNQAPRRGGGGVGRAFRTLLLVLFLSAVPLVTGYIAYKVTLHESWLP
jgi:hypothetical protein